MKAFLWILVVVIVILLGWWIFAYYTAAPSTAPATYAPTSTSSGVSTTQTVLATSTSATLGVYLIAPNGMTLYNFTNDTQGSGSSTCVGQCATTWPPYVVSSSAIAQGTIAGGTGTIGTITRSDGTMQVTYNGWPLYFYSKDSAPGDTNGQNVQGTWFVVTP